MDLGLGGRTVLLVGEDDPVRAALAAVFSEEGGRVLTTGMAPGDDSRARALQEPIDVVVVLEASPDPRPVDWLVDPEAVDRAWDPVVGAVGLTRRSWRR
ncbi:hypothetical protein [Blastococcus sp. CT_GayMR16]|uniref:hypothetical protein n=1 Tax=Blastococcus sp. CT_GayMR16 TaxID=2559607 RepID=UPI001073FE34|nr:hypothetical protein [Blastococcus sp. CT_GayMR16]TFV87338.1 hypothetical protein E4P38_13590 [Blastococcus sp. CT_GayMR16]